MIMCSRQSSHDHNEGRDGQLAKDAGIVYEVRANWKILIDNFNECLHCPGIHPELTKIVPIYRKGMVIEERDDGCTAVRLAEGARTFSLDGPLACPPSPAVRRGHRHLLRFHRLPQPAGQPSG
jgi:phenylpropionate dioxygenase-like ring-hydroxylating dioxygenase large terminal subunit